MKTIASPSSIVDGPAPGGTMVVAWTNSSFSPRA
jgi:hypothetical protein